MKQVISAKESSGRNVHVLGGFGNNWISDGPFLNWIVDHYGGFSVMINGGKSPAPNYKFFEIQQVKTAH